MIEDERHLVDNLLRIHADLARARGAARSRRDSGRVRATPPGPWQTAHGFGADARPAVDAARGMLDRHLSWLSTADWAAVDQLPEPEPFPGPVRIGTVRLGTGLGSHADLPAVVPLLDGGNVIINPADPSLAGRLAELFPHQVVHVVGNLVLRSLLMAGPDRVTVIGDHWLPSFLDRVELTGRVIDLDPRVPGQLENLFDKLRRRIETIHREHLGSQYASLADLYAKTGQRPVDWRLVVVSGVGPQLGERLLDDLRWLLQYGPACRLHLILVDSQLPQDLNAETVLVGHDLMRVSTAGPTLNVTPDAVPAADSAVLKEFDKLLTGLGLRAIDLHPAVEWNQSARDGLTVQIGDVAGEPFGITFGDFPAHALVGGPAGSGKTNLIYALIGGLTSRYSPDEVELYLLDFKQSVSFTPAAPSGRDPSWIPHARLIGINVNNDREFGIALLRHLREQMELRSKAVAQYGTDSLRGLRNADPEGRWPRIVAVIDEFQVLLGGRDAITNEAAALLEDVARRGRSFGIHLVLATQSVGSIEALWGRPGLVDQLVLRIAFQGAKRVLAGDNSTADKLPKYHAAVNAESGVKGADRVVRLADFSWETFLQERKTQAWEHRRANDLPPVLFDGDQVPALTEAADYRALMPGRPGAPVALVGRTIDVVDRAARLRLDRSPDRNLTVLGRESSEACDVLAGAVLSLARQYAAGAARFSLLAGGGEREAEVAGRLAEQLAAMGHQPAVRGRQELVSALTAIADEVEAGLTTGQAGAPHYVVFLAVDAASRVLETADAGRTGHDALRRIASSGSEVGTHLLAWWRTVQRMRDDLGGFATKLTEIGAWVALDVQGSELSTLPGGSLVTWSPRRRRALWFDASVHRGPQLIVPFDSGLRIPEEAS